MRGTRPLIPAVRRRSSLPASMSALTLRRMVRCCSQKPLPSTSGSRQRGVPQNLIRSSLKRAHDVGLHVVGNLVFLELLDQGDGYMTNVDVYPQGAKVLRQHSDRLE